ncbi:MAG: hypothetical protein ACYC6Y_17955 [Thermoguttaceae bacterium]
MILLESLLIAVVLQPPPVAENHGYLGGVVVRARSGKAAAGAEVVLCVGKAGDFIPAAKTTTDENGKFLFEALPVTPQIVYRPGANWKGIHYPGPLTQLLPSRSTIGVKLTVNETVAEPDPLVLRRHEITLRPRPGALEVSELLVIDNPTRDCYVGKAGDDGGEPETFCVHLPKGFERVTFADEFYGARFSVTDERLATGIPWMPGQEELRFSYVLRNGKRLPSWRRSLDMPCRDVTVRVLTEQPKDVTSSPEAERREEPGAVVFHYGGAELEAGRELRVDLEQAGVSPLAYGKWMAASALAVLVVVAVVRRVRRRRCGDGCDEGASQRKAPVSRATGGRSRGGKPRSVSASG